MAKLTLNKNQVQKDLVGGKSRIQLINEIAHLKKSHLKACDPKSIKTASPFRDVFPMKQEILISIQDSMREIGYDANHPMILWKERGILIDGHCRLKSALEVEISEVVFLEQSFSSEEDALRYTFALQFHRRNLDEADRFLFVEGLFHNNVVAEEFFPKGINRNNLAPLLSVAVSTAQKYISVIKQADEEDKKQIRQGMATVNGIYNQLHSSGEENVLKSSPVMKSRENMNISKSESQKVSLSMTFLEELFQQWLEQESSDITRTIRFEIITDIFSSHPEVIQLYDDL